MWNPKRAHKWLQRYAEDVSHDAYEMGGDEVLYAAAGAAYHAVAWNVGYHSQAEFEIFVKEHMKLDGYFLEEAIKEIMR